MFPLYFLVSLSDNQNILDIDINFNIYNLNLPNLKQINDNNDFINPINHDFTKTEEKEIENLDNHPFIIINPFIGNEINENSLNLNDSVGTQSLIREEVNLMDRLSVAYKIAK